MIYLLLSILSSSTIFVIFKLYSRFGINTLQAIVFNYFIAFTAGIILHNQNLELSSIINKPWFPGTILLGFLFIAVFYLAAKTTQRNGLSVVSVATKMSVAIPVLFGILLYGENSGPIKIWGILLALIAVYLTSVRKKEGLVIEQRNLVFPLLVFIGSGTIDTLIKYLETSFVQEQDVALFSSVIFAVAGFIGISLLLAQKMKGTLDFSLKNFVGGIALGIPNFFSIYFLVLALRSEGAESSTIFPINNVAIVMVSTFLGVALFHEKMRIKNWLGIALAVLSIVLIGFS